MTLGDRAAALLRFGEGPRRRWFFVQPFTVSARDEDLKRFELDDE